MNPAAVARSVVIASHNGPDALRTCLSSFIDEIDTNVELIVSAHFLEGEADALRSWTQERSLSPHLVEAPEAMDVPHLRVAGLRAARGEVVLLTEDHLIPSPSWIDAASVDSAVTTGAIALDQGGAVDRAVYLFEYGAFMPPLAARQAPSGANVAYSREAIAILEPHFDDFEWEHAWNKYLEEAGCTFEASDAMSVTWRHEGTFAKFCATARLHGQNFGARRNFNTSLRRFVQIACLPVMPFVLAAKKIVEAISRQPAQTIQWLCAAPALVALYVAWSIGEARGSLTGVTVEDTGWRA